jgi:nitric oxide reductase subunit C
MVKAWMQAQPSGAPGRRQMPQFHLSDQELDDLAAFFEWTSRIKTQNWPPNDAG